MFKMFTVVCKFFKSLVLQVLWIYNFCEFTRYLVFWLYFGCRDFPHFFTPDFPDELRKSKFLIVKGTFVSSLMSYGEIMFFKRVNVKCQFEGDTDEKNCNENHEFTVPGHFHIYSACQHLSC